MPDPTPPQVVVQAGAPDATWSTRDYVEAMEGRITHRFDRQDDALASIHNELKTMATKEDLRDLREDTTRGLSEVHKRIDGVEAAIERRVGPLEADDAAEKAVQQSRGRFRANLAWVAGIIGSLAIVGGTVFGIVTALH